MESRGREKGEKPGINASSRAARSAAAKAVFRDPSEELKAICAALSHEIGDWPQVAARGMFGVNMIYRGDRVIAALPKTKSLSQRDAILLKFYARPEALERKLAADSRIRRPMVTRQESQGTGEGAKWVELVIAGPEDVNNALEWLDEAYRAAKGPSAAKNQSAGRKPGAVKTRKASK